MKKRGRNMSFLKAHDSKGRSKRLWIAIGALLLCLAIVGGVFLARHLANQRQDQLLQYRDEALAELYYRQGSYDENKIVLANTSEGVARELSGMLGASLRITKDGSFAALTLPQGMTIRDVYANDTYLTYLKHMSADYQVHINDLDLPNGVLDTEGEAEDDDEGERPTYPSLVVPTDSSYALQTYLDYINLSSIWSNNKGNRITVAVIDTGIDTDHPEFAGRISPYSYNATYDRIVKDYTVADGSYDWSLIEDMQGHGTSVAGVIAAGDNDGGITGIAPDVQLLVIKAECDASGAFQRTSDLVFGLYYAIERDVNVVNMSFGAYLDNNPFASATKLAYDSDVICVAAAGNDSTAALSYPACDEYVIGVGALGDSTWEIASYSNFGESVNICAPGTVYTSTNDGLYGYKDGTSLASPVAAAVVALYMQTDRYADFDTVTELLYASAADLGEAGADDVYGYGAVDANAMLNEPRGTVTFHMLTDELDNVQATFILGHSIMDIPQPERLYSVFDGWYYDPQCTQEFAYDTDRPGADLTLYAGWVNEDDGIPFTYRILDDGTVEILSYTGHRRYITVPEKIEGRDVSSIGEGAFMGQTKLRQIDLPSTLRYIKSSAFAQCSNLLSMRIPAGVEEIGAYAFLSDYRLSSVSFDANASLRSIGSFAFCGCSMMKRIELPASVTAVSGSTFAGMLRLNTILVANGNTSYMAQNGVLFNATGTKLVAYPAALSSPYTVGRDVLEIGSFAFAYSTCPSIDLGNVQSIGNSAFIYASLRALTLPESVTAVGTSAFESNAKMTELTLNHSLISLPKKMFASCYELTEIVIPSQVQSIGEETFSATSKVSSVTFEEGSALVSIGGGAFSGCGLQTLNLPISCRSLGEAAFAGASRLSSVIFPENCAITSLGERVFMSTVSLQSIDLPSSLRYIGTDAFRGSGLQTVSISASVSGIGNGAFADCASLTAISVDTQNATYRSVSGVLFSKDMAVLMAYPAGMTRTSFTVPYNTVAVGPSAFAGASKLQSVSISNGVRYIMGNAFEGCTSVRSYSLPSTLEDIGSYAFSRNTALRSITLPASVTHLGQYIFQGDMNLSSISFASDSKLDRIGYGALAQCGVTDLKIPANVSTIAQGAFAECPKLKSITFMKGSQLPSISAYLFDGCSALESVIFESGSAVSSIQAHAFDGLRNLKNLVLSDAPLTNIDNFAFRFCSSLTELDIPEGVVSIGRYAFYYCTSLETVYIPTTVEHIGSYAFLGSEKVRAYFRSDTLPRELDPDWDHGIVGYYLDVLEVMTQGDFMYALTNSQKIALLEYYGKDTVLDLTKVPLHGEISIIGGKAFAYAPIEKIILPQSVTLIQNEAFFASSIKEISIPAGVTFIGRQAFSHTPLQALTFASDASLSVIEASAFEETEDLREVVLPASVEQLGRAVFRNSGIEKLTFAMGSKLTEIPEEAFAYTGVTSVVIPDSVILIDHGAFRETSALRSVTFGAGKGLMLMSNAFYRSGLESLHLPSNLTYIGECALTGLRNLKQMTISSDHAHYSVLDGVLYSKDQSKLITVPAGRTGSFTVPASVESIGFGAFEESRLSKVTFAPNINLLSIGYRAFWGVDGMTEISIPKSVVSIDYYAFANCTSLEKVTFEEGSRLSGVYEGAFYGDRKLHTISLPNTLAEIADFAFYGCASLTEFPLENTDSLVGVYDYAMAYTGITELNLPESLADIGNYAFMGIGITELTIPSSNAEQLMIGIGAFENCAKLERVTLPFVGACMDDSDITWFGYIFGAGAYEANSTYVPKSIKHVTLTEGTTTLGFGAFYQLDHIEKIDVPYSVSTIYQGAFGGTKAEYELTNEISIGRGNTPTNVQGSSYFGSGLKGHLRLAEGVETIPSIAGNPALRALTIPSTVTSLAGFGTSGCTSLEEYHIADLTAYGSMMAKNTSAVFDETDRIYSNGVLVTELVIDERATGVGGFANYSYLTSVVIKDGAQKIGRSAFKGCKSLETVVLSSSVTEIESEAFFGCVALTSVTVPDGLQTIGSSAFSGCAALTSIGIPGSITSIGNGAFAGCAGIKEIHITDFDKWCNVSFASNPMNNGAKLYINGELLTTVELKAGITDVSKGILWGCESVETVIIPEGVTSIGMNAFRGCINLKSVSFPSTLKTVEQAAFYGCTSLESVSLPNGLTDLKMQAFFGCTALKNIELPSTLTTMNNAVFSNCSSLKTITLPDSLTSLGAGCFTKCASLEEIVIPDGITSMGISMFTDCTSLSKVTLPKGLVSLGAEAFSGCSKLRYIQLPDTLRTLGSYTFRNCTGLLSVEFPEGMTAIPDRIFWGCSSLMYVVIPSTVTKIGDYAFRDCKVLYEVQNNSSLAIKPSNSAYGGVAQYATVVKDKNGNPTYSANGAGKSYFNTPDGFRFMYDGKTYTLIAYLGYEDTVTLPESYNGSSYVLSRTRGIVKAILPQNMTSLAQYAFADNVHLEEVVFPEGFTSIGYSAFEGCTSLAKIVIPETVTSIGSSAFNKCVSLKTAVMPKHVTTMGNYIFASCQSLEQVTLPQNLKAIPSDFFKNCVSLREVIIPEGVTQIGGYVFQGCTALETVTLPSTLQSISYSAFAGCSSLRELVLPEGFAELGDACLQGCVALKDLYIPASLTKIATNALQGTRMEKITVSPDNSAYASFGGVLYDYAKTKLLFIPSGLDTLEIPAGVTDISYAFQNNETLKKVSFEAGSRLQTVGEYAFSNCTALETVWLPMGVTEISQSAFQNCTALKEVSLPTTLKVIGSDAFGNCSALEEILLPDGLETIGERAFAQCSALRRIEIPDSVTTLEMRAFGYCTSLISVKLSESLTVLRREMFIGCSSLISIRLPDQITEIQEQLFSDCYSLRQIILSENITSLPMWAFQNCRALESLVIPDSVTTVGSWVFQGCTNLKSVTLPKGMNEIPESLFYESAALESIVIPEGITKIGDYAFFQCKNLKSVKLPSTLKTIGQNAFYECRMLAEIEIPAGVTEIGQSAFASTALTKVVIPTGVTEIADRMFSNCQIEELVLHDGITSIGAYAFSDNYIYVLELPKNLTTIGEHAFDWCAQFNEVTIPKTVTSIGNGAFYNCVSLKVVTNLSDIPLTVGTSHSSNILDRVIALRDRNGTVTCADGYFCDANGLIFQNSGGSYKLINYIGTADIVTLPLTVNGQSYTMEYMRGVKKVIIPNGFTSLSAYAFDGCRTLTEISLPDTLTSIETSAFANCALREIVVPNSVTDMGSYTFYGCKQLQSASFGEGLTAIGFNVFLECKNLSNIHLGSNIANIGANSFIDTAFYRDNANWKNGMLFIDKYLVGVSKEAQYIEIPADTICIQDNVFEGCYKLKTLQIGGDFGWLISDDCTNLETLILTSIVPDSYGDFSILTLKNVVLKKGVAITEKFFYTKQSGLNIFVEGEETDVRWDANFKGWQYQNRVFYGYEHRWIYADFYDENGEILQRNVQSTAQVIRQPYYAKTEDAMYVYEFMGWDLDGDGKPDTVPATSTVSIQAVAVVNKTLREYTVTFYDRDGVTVLSKTEMPYGSAIVLPTAPTKDGYTFQGWQGYTEGMTVDGNIYFTASWDHADGGHDFAQAVKVAPSCTEQGYEGYVCVLCGEIYISRYTDALGHALVTETIAPTCAEAGGRKDTCTRCGEEWRSETVAPIEHNMSDWQTVTAAGCVSEGIQSRACQVCGTTEQQTVAPSGHSYTVTVTKQPTCEQEGSAHYLCASCGLEKNETLARTAHRYESKQVDEAWTSSLNGALADAVKGYGEDTWIEVCEICHTMNTETAEDALPGSAAIRNVCDHKLSDGYTVLVEKTCSTYGVEGIVCLKCRKVTQSRVFGDIKGHQLVHYEAQAPTCDMIGWNAYDTCQNCDYNTYKELPKLEHVFVTTPYRAPTCTEEGWEAHRGCSLCSYSESKVTIPALGHRYEEVAGHAPSCTFEGWEPYTVCKVCGDSDYQAIPMLPHQWLKIGDRPATCTEKGWSLYNLCSVCGRTDGYVEYPALGHHYIDVAEKPATCTEEGWSAYRYCKNCEENEPQIIPPLGHWMELAEYQAPTCTDIGWTEHAYCTRCEYTEGFEELEMLPHTLESGTAQAASCTEAGWAEYEYCVRCDYTTKVTVPPMGHVFEVKAAKEATCTEDGWTEYQACTRCAHTQNYQIIPKTDHAKGEWVIERAPTCTESGERYVCCTHCANELERETIPASGHSAGEWVTVQAPTATDEGKRIKSCVICQAVVQEETLPPSSESTQGTTAVLPETNVTQTLAVSDVTAQNTASQGTQSTDAPTEGGCGSTLSSGFVLTVLLALSAYVTLKKRRGANVK